MLKKNLKEILEYCKPYTDIMWAARISGIILDCDFRDVKTHSPSEVLKEMRTPNDSKSMRECETGGEHEWEMDESTGQYFCEVCNEAME